MKRFWDRIFGLDYEHSIWVDEKELGTKKLLHHHKKRYYVKIPQKINKEITLRLRGLGKKRFNKTGHLFLHVFLNKGEDVRKSLWLSETSAINGSNKKLFVDGKKITMVIPPKSYNGLTIRLKGYGREASFSEHAPPIDQKKKGNLLVKLFVYPDRITPKYRSFDYLSTEDMALEGWVYRKYDDVIQRIGDSSLPADSIQAETIADLFNERTWTGIFYALVDHLKLNHLKIWVTKSDAIPMPGKCVLTSANTGNFPAGYNYEITINKQFLDNPFAIAAILAHELCHVIYFEKFDNTPKSTGYTIKSDQAILEMERTVDLLVFMYKIGEFQLRIARDKRLTLGYFNQEIFERIQVIVSKN